MVQLHNPHKHEGNHGHKDQEQRDNQRYETTLITMYRFHLVFIINQKHRLCKTLLLPEAFFTGKRRKLLKQYLLLLSQIFRDVDVYGYNMRTACITA